MSNAIVVYLNKETGDVEGVGLCTDPYEMQKRANVYNADTARSRRAVICKLDETVADAFAYLLGENQYKHLKETDDICDEVETLIDDIRRLDDTIDDLRSEFYDLNKRADRIKGAVAKLMPNA